MKIHKFNKKEWQKILEKSDVYKSFIRTPAGILEILSIDLGIFSAKFSDIKDNIKTDILQVKDLILHGTDFEIIVWSELLKIKESQKLTYKDIAIAIGSPNASRAVGNAIGNNHIAYFVPCHRVILKSSKIGGYLFGANKKRYY